MYEGELLKWLSMKINKLSRIIGFACLLLVLTVSVNAQKYKSVFKNLTWEQAAEQAQKEGKIVLVDAMRKARTPEDQKKQDAAERKLFSIPEIMNFCDQHVIAIHIDMGSEAGQAFVPKLMMNMYPTYGFFMPNGDILGVVSPYLLAQKPEKFEEVGNKALKDAEVKRNNNRSIQFEEISLKDAMAKAKKENRLIFIDAYTDYCQPCMLMVKNVFSLNKVADFYNQNFINLKMHFGKEKELAEKYGTSGYPAFLFINGDGKLVYMESGYTEGDEFIGYGKMALEKAKGIEFIEGDWNRALEQARQENKLIFMDCYTSWCGPCKQLAKTVFTDPDAANFFNEHFVNLKMDMEKGEGINLKDRFEVKAYPTLLFINGQGEVVHCLVGAPGLKELMEQAQLAFDGKGLAYADDEYQKGNREPELIQAYLTYLGNASLDKEAEKVSLDYFATLDKNNLKERKYWDIFAKYVNDVDSDLFQYVYEHRDEFYSIYGEQDVKRKIQNVWGSGANQFVHKEGDQMVLDKKGFKRYVKRMEKAKVDGWEDIASGAEMMNAEKIGDWKTYIALGTERIKQNKVSDLLLYNWGLRVNKQCKDKELRLLAAKWFDEAAAKAAKNEAEGKSNMMSYRTYFEKLAKDLKADVQ